MKLITKKEQDEISKHIIKLCKVAEDMGNLKYYQVLTSAIYTISEKVGLGIVFANNALEAERVNKMALEKDKKREVDE